VFEAKNHTYLNFEGLTLGLPFPKAHKAFSCVHQKRLESSLSHAVVRTTGKRTRFIEHEYIDKIKPQLQKAYLEIWGKWV
jgi:hypothetical protein